MTEYKTIVCLANSTKHGGRCVAGIELADDTPRAWVRPVSARSGHEVSFAEMRMRDGAYPSVLDVIRLAVVEAAPTELQPENWLLDDRYEWEKITSWSWEALADLTADVPSLWGTGNSSGKGENDRVAEEEADAFGHSIGLIWVDEMTLHVLDGGFREIKREVRAQFEYAGVPYDIRVSDPEYKRNYLLQADGHYAVDGCYLTISLAEPFDGHCYKVVAAIIERANNLGD